MIKRFFFLFSALVFLIGSTSSAIASGSLPTHTQLTPELKPAFPNNSYQVASVCFLGSGDGCGGGDFGKGDEPYEIDTVNQCKNEGYTITSCTLPSYSDVSCPYNDKYFSKCTPDNPRACKENGYSVFTCATGEVVDTSCPYDSNYIKCKCNPCSGYDYTYAQATVMGYVTDGSCQSCGETKYKRKPNPCSGYTSCECGGALGASVCYSGSTQKFDSCKPCCNEACPAGTTETNPGGCGGSTQNECKTKTCYYGYQSCFRPYFTDCCDDITGCPGPGFCSSQWDYCTYESDICRERGGVPHISCNPSHYINYINYGMNGSLECGWY